jgi:hypothetical protein
MNFHWILDWSIAVEFLPLVTLVTCQDSGYVFLDMKHYSSQFLLTVYVSIVQGFLLPVVVEGLLLLASSVYVQV